MGKIGEFRTDFSEVSICPRCLGMLPIGYPGALSRTDNETEICSACGTDEGMRDFFARGEGGSLANPATDWPITVSPAVRA